jgi:hypothetical protein
VNDDAVWRESDGPVVVDFVAEPYFQYILREIIENDLRSFGSNFQKLKIKVEITDSEEPAAFSEKEIIKEHKRIVAKIKIYDKNSDVISESSVDTFAMYDVSDEFPYSGKASKKSAVDLMLTELGHAIAMNIIAILEKNN